MQDKLVHRPKDETAPAAYDSGASAALAALRDRIFSDDALCDALALLSSPTEFAARIEALAAQGGTAPPAETVLSLLRQGPSAFPPLAPPKTWLPIRAGLSSRGTFDIDWARFGDLPLRHAFFGLDAQQQSVIPFNRFFGLTTAFADLPAHAGETPAPDGFIFHQSRCGSTLAARALAALPDTLMISEAQPLDGVVEMGAYQPDLPIDAHVALLRAMAGALTQRRRGETRAFVKLDSWHTIALPLFRRAFPKTPWIFLYRDPVEILVSQLQQRGMQTVPGSIPSLFYGIPQDLAAEEYCARALARIGEAALANVALGGGLFVNYREMPEALFTTIASHFGIGVDDAARARMMEAVKVDVKRPTRAFVADDAEKQRDASAEARRMAAVHMQPVYDALEAARLTEPARIA